MARRRIYPTLPGEVAGRTGDMNAEINRRESQFSRMPQGFAASKRLAPKPSTTTIGNLPSYSDGHSDIVDSGISSSAATPPFAIVPFFLSATQIAQLFDATGLGFAKTRYSGWAICNGNNGTPNLDGLYPRWSVTAAGTAIGTDTQTAGAGTYATTAAGTVGAGSFVTTAAGTVGAGSFVTTAAGSVGAGSFVTTAAGSVASHNHSNGTIQAEIEVNGGNFIQANTVGAGSSWTANGKLAGTVTGVSVSDSFAVATQGSTGSTAPSFTGSSSAVTGSGTFTGSSTAVTGSGTFTGSSTAITGSGTFTGSSSSVTGSSASFDNRPSSKSIVPVMRLS